MPHKYSLHHKSMKLITQNISLPFFFSEASFSLSDALNLCKSFIKVQYIPLFHQIYPGLCHSLKAPTPMCEYKSHFNMWDSHNLWTHAVLNSTAVGVVWGTEVLGMAKCSPVCNLKKTVSRVWLPMMKSSWYRTKNSVQVTYLSEVSIWGAEGNLSTWVIHMWTQALAWHIGHGLLNHIHICPFTTLRTLQLV